MDNLALPHHKILRSRTPPVLPRTRDSVQQLHTTGSGSNYVLSRSRNKKARPLGSTQWTAWKRRPRLAVVLLALVLGVVTVVYAYADFFILLHFKLRDRAYEKRWITGCGLRKRPMMFVRSSNELAFVWESNCDRQFVFEWTLGEQRRSSWSSLGSRPTWAEADVRTVAVEDETNTHFAYQAVLGPLEANTTYTYAVHLLPQTTAARDRQTTSGGVELARYSFKWLGLTHSREATSFQLVMLADNQFNLRMFHRILCAMLRYVKRSPLGRVPLILHAGDQVQNPDNLPQWQTDFWDAMTSQLPLSLGQTTPILLARGNHDWDETGENVYTGGSAPRRDWLKSRNKSHARTNHPGTYMSYSPHERCRVLVLDSNLDEMEQPEQEEWLEWELGRPEWTRASLRIVMVHVPPFLEYWDRQAWTKKRESKWSIFVRQRLTPLLSQHGASLVLSGHQHAYSRGFLPHSLHRAFTFVDSSSDLSPFAQATVRERGWEKSSSKLDTIDEEGTVYVIAGGAGGTLDEDKVEDWGFYDASVSGKHHFGWIGLGMSSSRDGGVGSVVTRGRAKKVYRVRRRMSCLPGQKHVTDVLEWRAIGLDGKAFDAFRIEAEGCAN
ncbi:hypothetical protein ACM66B_002413 [Microbotryomycetes sp. NB124-2]